MKREYVFRSAPDRPSARECFRSSLARRLIGEGGFLNLRILPGVLAFLTGLVLTLFAAANPQVSSLLNSDYATVKYVQDALSISINPSKDNTLYEYVDPPGDRSNAVGDHFFAGVTVDDLIRRGVLAFNIAGSIPPGSTITSVSLTMNMSRTSLITAQTIELHKLLADWGEGTSNANANEGQGAPATTNDATWRHRFHPTIFWTTQGGDFSGTVSASQSVGDIGTYSWSSSQMVTDVQSWLDNPANNFGWLVLGNESDIQTAKRFDTRESTSPPVLTIEYTTLTPTPTPTATPTATPTPSPTPTPTPFSRPLVLPPVTTNANVSVGIDPGCAQILDGPCTNMWTYGGTYPGLTIRRPTGQTTNVTFTNNLDPVAGALTVHNHGNHSSPENDGQPDDFLIPPGGSRTYTYTGLEDGGNQRGAMHFYHDHRMDVNGRNVWMGLTGLYILDDPADPATLPSGAFDVPLAIADRQFDVNNQIPYVFNPDGVTGDKFLVNGVYQPYFNVGDRKYRLRVLNASNFRTYNLALSTGDSFIQIGTESGLLPAPITRAAMRVGPAERLDVVVNFSGRLGQDVYLTDTRTGVQLLKFRVTQHLTDPSTIPATLRPLPDIGAPTVTRTWRFDHTGGHWTINGLRFDPNRIDVRPVLGATEKWIFTNPTGMPHTVHIHDVDQQCMSRDGGPCYPYETMKETWYLDPGEAIEVKLKFTDYTGRYMLHCHMIEHADDGMMTQFEVVAAPYDFNHDGRPDFVLYNGSARRTAIWYMHNNVYTGGAFGPILPAGWSLIDVADFNRDGNNDYALFNSSTRQTAIWYLSGTMLTGGAWGPIVPNGWTLVTTGDFNGDGKPDFVIYKPSTGQTGIWYLNNNVYAGAGFGPTLPAGWRLAGVADFNGNGTNDYALFNPGTRQSAIYYLSGTTYVSSAFGPTIASGYELMGTADFNGNGKPDDVLYNATTRRTALYYLNNNIYAGSALAPVLPAGWILAAP
jgi:spore coat protein A